MGVMEERGYFYMKSDTRVFVSYTQRDGRITIKLLERFAQNLGQVCYPFIHIVHSTPSRLEQFQVLAKLIRSHMLLIIESPKVYKSPWVIMEIVISKVLMIPIIKMPVSNLAGFND